MLRTLIAATLLAAPLIAADANGAPGEPGPLEVSQTGAAKAQECRTAATASTTKTTSPGFTSETSTTCRYDKATNKSTCTNKYKDSFKTETTTVSVTTYAKARRRDRRNEGQSASPAVAQDRHDGRRVEGEIDDEPGQHLRRAEQARPGSRHLNAGHDGHDDLHALGRGGTADGWEERRQGRHGQRGDDGL